LAQFGQNGQSNELEPSEQTSPLSQIEGMDRNVKAEPTAAAALGLAVLALLTALASSRFAKVISTVTAAACAICLFLLKSKAGGEMPPEALAIIAIEWTTAFWVALIGSVALAGYTFHLVTKRDADEGRPKLVIQPYQPTPSEKVPSQT
jgi:lysylphosphatidylglycerol synthetase-like protein (DUF2156 family)